MSDCFVLSSSFPLFSRQLGHVSDLQVAKLAEAYAAASSALRRELASTPAMCSPQNRGLQRAYSDAAKFCSVSVQVCGGRVVGGGRDEGQA